MKAEHFRCPECGPHVRADEDGCCATCGADCVGEPCGGHVCGDILAAAVDAIEDITSTAVEVRAENTPEFMEYLAKAIATAKEEWVRLRQYVSR
jgi:hypothetical protein